MTASTHTVELLVVAGDEFARRLRLVGPDDWRPPTPCSEWDVRALVNHVVGGCVRQAAAAADVVVSSFCEDGALEPIVHHPAGDRTGRELLSMRVLDSAVHSWDLARAIGAEETLDDEVVTFLLAYTSGLHLGPEQRAFAPADADVPRDASSRDRLLHRLGRHPNITEEAP